MIAKSDDPGKNRDPFQHLHNYRSFFELDARCGYGVKT